VNKITTLLAIVAFAVPAAFSATALIRGYISSGEADLFEKREHRTYRSEDPIGFWQEIFFVTCFFVAIGFLLLFAGLTHETRLSKANPPHDGKDLSLHQSHPNIIMTL
jgi:hypothetical protein